ncbi:MAG: hypothetical protein ACI4VP_04640 [Clostridia bacterium]
MGEIQSTYAYTGGITGYSSSKIINCYNISDMKTNCKYGAGICGYNTESGLVINCYNIGEYASKAIVRTNAGTVTNCYYLVGGISDGNAIEKTEEEMKTAEFIVSLNINTDTGAAYETSVWIQDNEEIPINRGYPIFIWQSE